MLGFYFLKSFGRDREFMLVLVWLCAGVRATWIVVNVLVTFVVWGIVNHWFAGCIIVHEDQKKCPLCRSSRYIIPKR